MFSRQARYRSTVRDHGFRLLRGYDDHDVPFQQARAALAVRARPPVP
jgi:hypothetical protein